MTLLEFYAQVGGDYVEAQRRLMKDERIIKYLNLMAQDTTMNDLKEAVAMGNKENAFRAAHTLKGIAGNLALTRFAAAASALCEQLRPLKEDADPALLAATEEAYNCFIKALAELQQ
ncbi:MAG: Hpt domain-containing protein [Paludibacteraceae bacterium]